MALWEFVLNHSNELLTLTGEHLWLVSVSMLVASALGIPAGIVLTRRPDLKRSILGFANVVQTVPSLALFGFLIPLPVLGGIGARTAIVALILYALLPIIRNTYAGITSVDASVKEAGWAMGMTSSQLLWKVEIPLALPVILSGVRVATITCVGVATIAAAIGAGGLGMYIFRGVAGVNTTLILAGSIPAAGLALVADFGLGRLERVLAPAVRAPLPAERPAA